MVGLLTGLLFCHYLADFTHLSRPYMLKAKAIGSPWGPIYDHALVHGTLMMIWVWWQVGFGMAAATWAIETMSHFGIDVLKGKLNVWYPSLRNPANPFHWYVFGADQLMHILVIIGITVISI